MLPKGPLSILIPVAVFVIAAALVYVSFTPRRAAPPPKSQAKIEGMAGLNEGDRVDLPTLATLEGESVALSRLNQNKVLCVFFTPSCPGCSREADLWEDLNDESKKQDVPFYVIDVGNDKEALTKFIVAYKLEALPILFDTQQKVGPALKINFVPMYLLFASDGTVLRRWDGVRNNTRRDGPERVAEFFQSGSD